MNQLDLLRQKTNELLQNNVDNENERKKFEIIENILTDDDCFLKIDIEYAYAILRDLGVSEDQVRELYSDLIAR